MEGVVLHDATESKEHQGSSRASSPAIPARASTVDCGGRSEERCLSVPMFEAVDMAASKVLVAVGVVFGSDIIRRGPAGSVVSVW